MRRLLPLFMVVLGALAACRRDQAPPPPRAQVPTGSGLRTIYIAGIDSLDLALQALAALPSHPDSLAARDSFRRARAAYKRIEYLVEFTDPIRAGFLNRPPIPIVNEDDPTAVIPPAGLQVVEAVVFPRPAPSFAKVVHSEVEQMRRVLGFIRRDSTDAFQSQRMTFDAARSELARITTLGLAGFDATVSKDGLVESAQAIRGVEEGLAVYQPAMRQVDPDGWDALHRSLAAAITHLEAGAEFDDFDRLDFLVRFANPIASGLNRLGRSLHLPEATEPSPWTDGATNIYAAGALNPHWFAPDYAPPSTPELIALGRRLFFEPALSRDGRRSCATCHEPSRAFTDGRHRAEVDPGHGFVRNTPTLLNSGLQRAQFADQRVPYLEFQFEEVMANPREMALPATDAAQKLGTDSVLVGQFAAAFRKPRAEALTRQSLSIAVAAYVRSLQGMNSRFDRAVRGDTGAITPSERRGFDLFMGKAACGTCHFAPVFGGSMPPKYLESEPEVIGVPATATAKRPKVDDDPGVFAIDRAPLHRHAFKTPTLRNIALTAPYMHNGVFGTLEKVVDFYDKGGGNGLGMKLPNQTLPSDKLHLSHQEKRDLVAFLNALTDSAYALTPPPRQP
jgi:cytochrome c peroxidase